MQVQNGAGNACIRTMQGRIAAGRPSKVELRLPKPEFRLQTYDSVHPDRKSSKSDQFGQVSRVEIPELPKLEFRLRNYIRPTGPKIVQIRSIRTGFACGRFRPRTATPDHPHDHPRPRQTTPAGHGPDGIPEEELNSCYDALSRVSTRTLYLS